MKARVKKLGTSCPTVSWIRLDHEYEVVGGPYPCKVGSAFKHKAHFAIFVDDQRPEFGLHQLNSRALGGNGSEWELIDDDCNDAYDRAMGIL